MKYLAGFGCALFLLFGASTGAQTPAPLGEFRRLALENRPDVKAAQQAVRVRETVQFSYEQGGASLLDFLNAENDYRSVELNYANLVGAYLMAAAQLNLAVGREVIP